MSVLHIPKHLFLIVLCTTLFAASAYAISMDINVGFDGVIKSGTWAPVAVTFTNKSSDNVQGVLTANQIEPEGNAPVCSANVTLPANSKKLYHVYTKLSGYSTKMQVTFVAKNGAVTTKNANLTAASESDKVVVSVGGRTARLNFLNGEKVPATVKLSGYGGSAPGDAAINVGSISPRELPDRPAAYEGIDLLVINSLTPDSVNSRSLQALSMWVASGGTLVVSAGANYGEYAHEFYKDLLPVKVTGLADVPGLASFSALGGAAFPAGPVAVAQSTVKPGIGRVLLSQSGMPILVDRTYGSGRVLFLALDHQSSPFRDWNGQTEFWKRIITSASSEPLIPTAKGYVEKGSGHRRYYNPNEPQEGRPAMAGVVEQNPSVKTPSISTIGLFLLMYIVALVPVNYFVLKKRRKLELAWVTTPAIIILFTVGAYAVGYTMKGDRLQLREATIIEGSSGARFARSVTDASIFSPARRSYNVEIKDNFSLASSIASEEGETPSSGYIADTLVIEDMAMAMWSSKTLESVAGVDLGGTIDSDLVVTNGQANGRIENNTNYALTNCTVVFAGAQIPLGDIPSGGSAEVDAKRASSQWHPTTYPSIESVESRVKSFAADKAKPLGAPVLVATIARDKTFTVQRNRPSVDSGACCIIKLGYKVVGPLSIQPGSIRGRTEKMENADVRYYGPNQSSPNPGTAPVSANSGGWFINSYTVPVPAGATISKLFVNRSVSGISSRDVVISLFNVSTESWNAIGADTDVANAGRYVDTNGEVRVKVLNKNRTRGTQVTLVLSAMAKPE